MLKARKQYDEIFDEWNERFDRPMRLQKVLNHARSKFVLSSISNLVCTYRIPQESEDVEMVKSEYLGKVTIEKVITIMNKK